MLRDMETKVILLETEIDFKKFKNPFQKKLLKNKIIQKLNKNLMLFTEEEKVLCILLMMVFLKKSGE